MPARSAIVRVGLGMSLLVAAGLKLYGLSTCAVPRVGWFAQPWVQVLTAEWELVLGAWLLSGTTPRLSWLAALVTFVTFSFVSGYLGWVGVASCGCFGALEASPWWAFGVDVLVLVALTCARPVPVADKPQLTLRSVGGTVLVFFIGTAVLLSLLAGIGTWVFGSLDTALARLRGERMSVRPGLVDVGRGPPGRSVEVTVELVNRTDRLVRVIGGSSDCFCVVTNDLPLTLEPQGSRLVQIRVQISGPPGQFNRTAFFWTDDDRARVIVFPLTGRIEPPILVPSGPGSNAE